MEIAEKTRKRIFLLLACGMMLLAGCGQKPEAKGPAGGMLPEVGVVTVKEESVEITRELPGRVSAFLVAEVRPQVNGIIRKRLFEEGKEVKAGDVLYQIDPTPYRATLGTAQAALIRAEANLPALQERKRRYQELLKENAVSAQEYDDISAALRQVEADVQYGKTAVETARINLSYTDIKAPVSGRIGKSNITVGSLATAGQPAPLAVIQKIDQVFVDATQSSSDLLQMKQELAGGKMKKNNVRGAKVKLLLEDGTPYPLQGEFKFSDITVNPSTGSFLLRIAFPNPQQTLLPGMYVRAVVREGIKTRAILVLQQGVTRDFKGRAIAMVVDPTGKVEQRFLKIDRAIGDRWLIFEGLKAGERVIMEGLQKIRAGVQVKVFPFDSKPPAPPLPPTSSGK
ncbi:MAG: efflux RND transporter periplasmic adaptor subunit [Syntrophales bacterium]